MSDNEMCPVKWCAAEVLADKEYSHYSDVVSERERVRYEEIEGRGERSVERQVERGGGRESDRKKKVGGGMVVRDERKCKRGISPDLLCWDNSNPTDTRLQLIVGGSCEGKDGYKNQLHGIKKGII